MVKERKEYFSQEIQTRDKRLEQDEADVRTRNLIATDPVVWQHTYEDISAKAWRAIDLANLAA